MKLLVIQGGRGDIDLPVRVFARPTAVDVHAEAQRRIHLTGYNAWRLREFATGSVMPKSIRNLYMQISFVAEAMARLDGIPDDFRSDIYWPVG